MKNTTFENSVSMAMIVVIFGALAYFGGSAMVDLWRGIYEFLDGYIWAFFAGIIAFFFTLSITGMIIQITVWSVMLVAGLLSAAVIGLIRLFKGKL